MHVPRVRVTLACVVSAAVLLTAALYSAKCAEPASGAGRDLAGLWQAKHLLNGPEISGRLVIRRDSLGWEAQIAGVSVPVNVDNSAVTFELPGAKGSFTGRWEAGRETIFGHWIQAPTDDSGQRYVSPVALTRDADGIWRGEVDPLDDHMAFYLVVRPGQAGATTVYPAFLVNPERNLGHIWDVDRLERDGDSLKLLGSQTGRQKGAIMAEGVYHEETGVLSFFFEGRGGTYDFERVPANAVTDFYPRGRPTAGYVYTPPLPTDDGWPVANLDDVGLSRTRITAFVKSIIDAPVVSVHSPQLHGILIARHGKLVLEEYFHGENRDKPHETRSAAKSLTATLFGAAMQAGLPVSTSTHVYSAMNGGTFPAGLDPLKRSLTVESLLTMSSGLDCDDSDPSSTGYEDKMTQDPQRPDIYANTLALKMIRSPGTKWAYCSVGANMVGGVLTRATHQTLQVLFQDLLAKPLQINRYYLALQPTGEPYMGGGVRLLPRDFMKLGQLLMDGGTWHGRRILSRNFSARASSPLVKTGGRIPSYGYLWWIVDFPYKGGTIRTFDALGNGGQEIIAIPKLDMVVALYAGSYADDSNSWETKIISQYVLPAVIK